MLTLGQTKRQGQQSSQVLSQPALGYGTRLRRVEGQVLVAAVGYWRFIDVAKARATAAQQTEAEWLMEQIVRRPARSLICGVCWYVVKSWAKLAALRAPSTVSLRPKVLLSEAMASFVAFAVLQKKLMRR